MIDQRVLKYNKRIAKRLKRKVAFTLPITHAILELSRDRRITFSDQAFEMLADLLSEAIIYADTLPDISEIYQRAVVDYISATTGINVPVSELRLYL